MLRSILSNWVALVFTTVLTFLVTPVLIHGLGEYYYGLWVAVSGVVDHYGLLDIGLRTTLHRYIARVHGANDHHEMRRTLSTALAMTTAAGALVAVLSFALAKVVPILLRVEASQQLLCSQVVTYLGLTMALTVPARALGAIICGLQRFDLYNLVNVLVVSLRSLLFVVALHQGYGVLALSIITLVAAACLLVLNWIFLSKLLADRPLRFTRPSLGMAKELIRFGCSIFLVNLGDQFRLSIGSIVVARQLGVAAVTPFAIALRLSAYFKLLLSGVVGPLLPAMSALEGRCQDTPFRALFLRGTRITAILSVGIGGLLLLDARSLITVWLGESLLQSYPLVAVMTAADIFILATSPSISALYARGRHHLIAWLSTGETIMTLGLCIWFVNSAGLMGAVYGCIVPMLVLRMVIQPSYALRVLDMPASLYFRQSLLRPALIALIMLCVVLPLTERHITDLRGFLWTIAWQATVFSMLAYWLGLMEQERHRIVDAVTRLLSSLIRAKDSKVVLL
jgi:O-antigen/teichoic acid export membrane protein